MNVDHEAGAARAGDPGDKFADLLVELFDAIMSTLRWTRTSADQQIPR